MSVSRPIPHSATNKVAVLELERRIAALEASIKDLQESLDWLTNKVCDMDIGLRK